MLSLQSGTSWFKDDSTPTLRLRLTDPGSNHSVGQGQVMAIMQQRCPHCYTIYMERMGSRHYDLFAVNTSHWEYLVMCINLCMTSTKDLAHSLRSVCIVQQGP